MLANIAESISVYGPRLGVHLIQLIGYTQYSAVLRNIENKLSR